MRHVWLFAPSLILLAWAAVLALGHETHAVTVGGRVLLAGALAAAFLQEWLDSRA